MLCLQAVWKDNILPTTWAEATKWDRKHTEMQLQLSSNTQVESSSIKAVQFPPYCKVIKIRKDALYFLAGATNSTKHVQQGFPKY